MKPLLYHADLGLPDEAGNAWTFKEWKLAYSRHALQAALTDRYGTPKRLPKTIQFTHSHIFEIEVYDGKVTKVCVRIPSGECDFEGPLRNMDLCLVLRPSVRPDTLNVITVWFNERGDTHQTLDASKYTRP